MTIFDARGPNPLRRVGHFAAPGARFAEPLGDGRAVVAGGNHLWLVGAPPAVARVSNQYRPTSLYKKMINGVVDSSRGSDG
jgi:hypothetical protein